MITLYNVVSSDGFIAAPNGSEDFIPDEQWDRFLKLLPDYDAVIYGRKTYEAVQKYDAAALEAFEKTPITKLVVSTQADFKPKAGYTKISSPQEALEYGKNMLLSSGGSLNEAFVAAGLVDKLLQVRLPISIDAGIRALSPETKLRLESEQPLENGAALREFSIIR